MRPGPTRTLAFGAVVLVLGLLLAGGIAVPAWAEEEPAEPPADAPIAEEAPEETTEADDGEASAEADEEPMSLGELEDWLRGSPFAFVLALVLRFGLAIVGVFLLVLAWRRYDRVRRGVEPPVPTVEPTVPLTVIQGVFLLVCAYVGASVLVKVVTDTAPETASSLVFRMASLQAVFLIVFGVVVFRRHQLGVRPDAGPVKVLGRAGWAFCVASAFMLPAGFVTMQAMEALDLPLHAQGPIEEFVESSGATPWLITFFAVFVAPIGEEALFRGLLYPALRGPRATKARKVWAAIFVSALFAAFHMNLPSALPLFALALVLTWLFERTNSLLAVILTHGLWNAATMVPFLLRMVA
jgi:membrane protease YdiL (CAAX protease family)